MGRTRARPQDARRRAGDQAARVLLAFEAAEREPSADAQRRLLTFVIVGGGPTGRSWPARSPRLRGSRCARIFGTSGPSRRRILLLEGAPHLLNAFPAAASRSRARSRSSAWVSTSASTRSSPASTPTGVTVSIAGSRRAPARADRPLGRWRRGISDCEGARCAARSRRPRPREPTLAVPGHPEIFVAGDICAFSQDGEPLPGVAQVAKQEGAHAAGNVLRAIRGRAARAIPLSQLRQHGDHWPRVGSRRYRSRQGIGSPCLAHLALHSHLLADRVPEPDCRAWRMGMVVPHVPASRTVDYRKRAEKPTTGP